FMRSGAPSVRPLPGALAASCAVVTLIPPPRLGRHLDLMLLQPLDHRFLHPLISEREPALPLRRGGRQHVLEATERATAAESDIEKLPQTRAADRRREIGHPAVLG